MDVAKAEELGVVFRESTELISDLDHLEAAAEADLAAATSKTKTKKATQRLDAVEKARAKVQGFGESHAVGEAGIPAEAVSKVRNVQTEAANLRRLATVGRAIRSSVSQGSS